LNRELGFIGEKYLPVHKSLFDGTLFCWLLFFCSTQIFSLRIAMLACVGVMNGKVDSIFFCFLIGTKRDGIMANHFG
jgi:hypothetical protein